jgi:hypothetical protein
MMCVKGEANVAQRQIFAARYIVATKEAESKALPCKDTQVEFCVMQKVLRQGGKVTYGKTRT